MNRMTVPNKVIFDTVDGVRIEGSEWVVGNDAPWALLLHMMPETKESWSTFASVLNDVGWNALAIDLRGHGGSIAGPRGELDYKTFIPNEHQASRLDLEAAVEWLVTARGAVRSKIALCGASIGANLALEIASRDARLPAVAALSPGLDYRGVTTEDKIVSMPAATKIWLAASDDDEESLACVRQLAAMRPDVTLRELRGAGHGTRMFQAVPELLATLADWLRNSVR